MIVTLDDVRRAVRLDAFEYGPAQERMAPKPRGILPENEGIPPREAGVLALLYPEADGLHIILTRRADHLRGHSGQISFPGGKHDAEDGSYVGTALRETCEELGICDEIAVLGSLSPFYIPPSHFYVYPSVGALETRPQFYPNPAEVAEVITFALRDLLDPAFKHEEYRNFNGMRIQIPYYDVNGHKVWGATAVMLGEFEARLRMVIEP